MQVFMKRLQSREDDENDKLIPLGSVDILLSNIEDLYKVSFTKYFSVACGFFLKAH